jgi:acyl-CoA thioesterase-2
MYPMDSQLADLLHLFDLEELEENLFRGESQDIGTPQVFGGQVLGQALYAGSRTVAADRSAHSLHAYFLRPGDVNAPIDYQIDHSLDGRSFSNRRIIAVQHGKQIFNMTASFQRREEGLSHHAAMPEVSGPDGIPDFQDLRQADIEKYPEKIQRFLKHRHPFLVRVVPREEGGGDQLEPVKFVWMKSIEKLDDDPALHRRLLAYISDYQLLSTATLPHGDVNFLRGQLQMASIDHAMWFHRPCRVDEWLLFSYDSPSASGARGLARGQIFTQDGMLRASTAQEGLIRPRN